MVTYVAGHHVGERNDIGDLTVVSKDDQSTIKRCEY